ncbi:MAG: beta-N-acetylhexosaminidase, partial [Anaerolineae bacterium]|nr:beta-N-acetylhexosaminidase [Anaerolineae bacterium]
MVSIAEKVGRMMLVGFEGYEAPQHILHWLEEGRIGGVILFARNIQSPEQLARLTRQIHAAARYPIFISIDQEGGTVARLRDGFIESPGAMALSAAADSEALSESMSRLLAEEMHALGINWNYAPVVDLLHSIENPSVGTRSYGSDRERVGRMAAAAVRGFQSGGVAACPKHFPGLGNTPVDTHVALAVITDSPDYLYEHDLVPFRAAVAAGAASVMMTHVKFEALDSEFPSTMSPVVVGQLLRDEIGFDGVITTDCMEMKAITNHYGSGEAAVRAVMAGIDVVLNSHTVAAQEAAFNAVVKAVESGRIPEQMLDESLRRITGMLERFPAETAPNPGVIRQPDRVNAAYQAARAGITLVQSDPA